MSRRFKRFLLSLLAIALLVPQFWNTPKTHAATSIPVVLYHVITDNPSGDYQYSTANFKKHMKYLNDNGYTTLSAEQYVDIVVNGGTAPAKPILLTFDDATPDFITNALPVLTQYNMKAVSFVIQDNIGSWGMTLDQLNTLKTNPNISLQNHTKSHDQAVWKTGITKATAETEIQSANEFLHDLTGQDPILLAYPYGVYNADVKAAAAENGIKVAFKAWAGDEDAMAMGRVLVMKNDTLNTFAAAISGPVPPAPEAIGDVVLSNDFEGSTQGWFKRGSETVTASTYAAHGGTGSLLVEGREQTWNGPGFNLAATGKLNKESTYEFSAYVKLKEGTVGSETIQFGAQQTGAANEYANPGNPVTVTADAWVQVKGDYTYDMDAGVLQVYLQSNSSPTVDFYVDDFSVKVLKPAVMVEQFESGQAGWTGNGATATVTNSVYRSSGNSLLVTGRTQNYHGPSLVLTDALEKGAEYEITAYARLAAGAAPTQLKATMEQTGLTGSDQFKQVTELTAVTDSAWVKLSGTYTYNSAATAIKLYFESLEASATTSFAIDDVVIRQTKAGVVTPPGFNVLSQSFEDGQPGGWADLGWNGTGTVSVSSDFASDGTKSLLYANRTDRRSSVSLNLTNTLVSGHQYDISFKLRSAQGTDTYHLGSKVTSGGTDDYPWIIANQSVTDSAWQTFELKGYEVPANTTEFLVWIEANIYDSNGNVDPTLTAKADFYLDEFVIKDVTPGAEPPRTPAVPFHTVTFEDQTNGGFAGRAGTETLTVTNEANHTDGGAYSLKVEGRTDAWHGPTIRVEKNVDKGFEYKVTAWVKLISPTSSQLQLSTQIGNGSGASYNTINGKTVSAADGWVKLEGNFRYSSVGDEFLTIYVESSNNKTASYYVDDLSFVNTGAGAIGVQKDLTPIKTKYQDDFLIGNAITAADLEGTRLELLKMHHNVVTAENAMKPDGTQPTKGNFTWSDSLVDGAIAQGFKVHGHVLVWNSQTPDWMNRVKVSEGVYTPLSSSEALANMKDHIEKVIQHYGDKVISWDVVNEAIEDNPSEPEQWRTHLDKSPWFDAIGADYVEQAFLAARKVVDDNGWDIKLYYNDYNDDNANKAKAIASMVKELNDKYALTHPGKLLIDGIGMQAHYNINTKPDNVEQSLEKFISLGVEVSVTELDMGAGTGNQLTEKQSKAQAYLYAQLMKIYKDHSDHIARVTFWGLTDASSWRSDTSPLLFDKDLQAKRAYYGAIDPETYIAGNPPEIVEPLQATAKFATPVIDGTVDSAWSNADEILINRYQQATNGATGKAKALWDDQYLYVLVQVNDSQLNKTSEFEYEQDSVEVFVDQNNDKSFSYQSDDGQYRVNFDNETSFNPTSKSEGFASATSTSGTNYTVELKIPLNAITPANNAKIGFDVQINDAKDGARQSVAAWNDTTGTGYQDTSVYGVLTLTGKGGTQDNVTLPPAANEPKADPATGAVTLKPVVSSANGVVSANVSRSALENALKQATPNAAGKKQIIVDVPAQAGATAYGVQLPVSGLKDSGSSVISIITENGTVDLPGNMLAGTDVGNAGDVTVRVGKVKADSLGEAVRNQIGDRPVINLEVLAGDSVIAWNNPNAAVSVAIPYTPTAQELSNPDHIIIWYIDGSGKATPVPNARYDAASGTVKFSTTHFSNYAVAFVIKTFDDLKSVPWAKKAIEAMASRGIINGTSEQTYDPNASIKRADFLALLVRALELKGNDQSVTMFSDVASSAYYYDAVKIAKQLGIVEGTGSNQFNPNRSISRQDMMVIAARAIKAAGKALPSGGTLSAFSDAGSVAAYAEDSATALVQAGIVEGSSGKLAPNGYLSRAEAAVILQRIWSK